MSLENVKTALGEIRPPAAKKSQNPSMIQMIKEATIKHILSNIVPNQPNDNVASSPMDSKVQTRKQSATKEISKTPTKNREDLVFLDIRDQELLVREFEPLSYPCHDDDDVPVICEGCWNFQSDKKAENLMKCNACNAYLHRECMGIDENKEDLQKYFNNGFCLRCYSILTGDLPTNSIKCAFCPSLNGIIIPFYADFWTKGHFLCIRFFRLFHQIKKKCPLLFKKLIEETIENEDVCYACKIKNGFSVRCNQVGCTLKIHISCGLRKGLINPSEPQETSIFVTKFSKIRFRCMNHCTEKSTPFRQRFSSMASSKPKKNIQNHTHSIPFLGRESLVVLGLIPPIFGKDADSKIPTNSISEEETHSPMSDTFFLNKNFSQVLNISQTISFKDIQKLRQRILEYFKEKGVFETKPKRGVDLSKLSDLFPTMNGRRKRFVNQANLWKILEKHLFDKPSYEKLSKYRIKRPKTRLMTKNASPLPIYEKRVEKEDPIQRSIERLRNYSPSPPGSTKKGVSPKPKKRKLNKQIEIIEPNGQNQPEIQEIIDKENNNGIINVTSNEINQENLNEIDKENNNGLNNENKINENNTNDLKEIKNKSPNQIVLINEPESKPLKKSHSKTPYIKKLRVRKKKASVPKPPSESSSFYSRSRSRSESQSRHKRLKKIEKLENKNLLPQPILTISDIINQQKDSKKAGNIDNEQPRDFNEFEYEDSPHVSEKEIRIRRQINEDKVRKLIAKIDAPGYSIDRNITFFKDIENVAHREDVFDDLMGDLFKSSNPEEDKQDEDLNISEVVEKKEPDQGFIIVQEDEEKTRIRPEPEILREKLKAYEFAKKDEREKEEWLEKRVCLSKKPFQSRHIINSVASKCLENIYDEKDLGNIGSHFFELKLV